MNDAIAWPLFIGTLLLGVGLLLWACLFDRPVIKSLAGLASLGICVWVFVVNLQEERADKRIAAQECVDQGGIPYSSRHGFERCLYPKGR